MRRWGIIRQHFATINNEYQIALHSRHRQVLCFFRYKEWCMNLLHLVTAFSLTCLTLLALKPVAGKAGLVDIPGGRKNHRVPTPLVGGIGIFLGTVFVCLFV